MRTLLNISIPTFNRPEYLWRCLKSIKSAINELNECDRQLVSVYVSDNSDDEKSKEVVGLNEFYGLNVIYSRNEENIGSDKNIARCYLYDSSDYVMVLGDDDFISLNSLSHILPFLALNKYPIVFLKSYGLTRNENQLREDRLKDTLEFNSVIDVLMTRNMNLTFISSMIFRRSDYSDLNVNEGVGTNLVQLNLVLYLLNRWGGKSLAINANLVLSTRNNTGGYDPIEIFGISFFNAIEKYSALGTTGFSIFVLKKKLLHTFYNRSVAQYMRRTGGVLSSTSLSVFDNWFCKSLTYKLFYRPLFCWNSTFSFYMLSLAYVVGNMFYNPIVKTYDFFYHFKTCLRIYLPAKNF